MEFISQGLIGKEHWRAITELLMTNNLSPWLTTEQAWEELAKKAGN